ncbi:MAG TPA: acyl-CoA thioesterase [Kofleriaceae bacterium]|nr:acyl-CoA thioesterase [Kofleriaceae bacterium]
MDAAPRFRLEVIARPEDIDLLGHVSNITYVRWIQEVAEAHSTSLGWDHAAYVALGAVFVVRRHEIDYRAPAMVGDRVALTTWAGEWRAASAFRHTEIANAATGAPLASAVTTWALVATEGGRPRRIPDALRLPFCTATP